ncbi:CoA transferase [Dehalococcoidia bacterium]|nr:CoA transferase [Dehalococcoidia bacterium]
MASAPQRDSNGFLFDIRVLELADQKGEFLGKLLAGAGADVIKVEPLEGNPTRAIGPFYGDEVGLERSLHFWHYNYGKRGVTLDITKREGQRLFKRLVPNCDVLIETFPPGYMESLGLGYRALAEINPRLISVAITPFGQSGPWCDFKGSDLVSLALGGVMKNCGYDPTLDMTYDTPPIAPQMWHASHIACAQANIAVMGALLWREQSGRGQYIDLPMHQAIATNTEQDVPAWVFNRAPFFRQTGKHAGPIVSRTNQLTQTKDGRVILTSPGAGHGPELLVELLRKHGIGNEIHGSKYDDIEYLRKPEVAAYIDALMKQWAATEKFDRDLWKEGQGVGYNWAPVRRPEENAVDPHWQARETFYEVQHQDIGQAFTYVGAPWLAEETPWRKGLRAPYLSEHTLQVLGEIGLSATEIEAAKRDAVI